MTKVPVQIPQKIKKRDGRVVPFDPQKITEAILKAGQATKEFGRKEADKLSDSVTASLVRVGFNGRTPEVEQVQDMVELVLIKGDWTKTAKAYKLYREEHRKTRVVKSLVGVEDDLKLSVNALEVLKKRYLRKNDRGEVTETPSEMFRRVAKNVASADLIYDSNANVSKVEETFFQTLTNLEFLPNSPTLRGAGRSIQQLSACFVIPVEDSIEGIFDALKYTALVHKGGGGTGFSFGRLRPRGDTVGTTGGRSSGPISFMRIFNAVTQEITQGGTRVGANMGILPIDHPDILDFITCKADGTSFSNFNISVALTKVFMEAVRSKRHYNLVNPRTGGVVRQLLARDVFEILVAMAWKNGDPGIIFIDRINQGNPVPNVGEIEATNPCGEQPLLPFESCNLGSINLARMVVDREISWEKLGSVVRSGVHFLDNVIDKNKFPLEEIRENTLANRKIGLGVMGFADMLVKLGVPYNSKKALKVGERVMGFVTKTAREESARLGKERGSFPNFEDSVWPAKGFTHLRNAVVTTIAPTGTLSTLANCSSGIEPIYALAYSRKSIFSEQGVWALELMVVNEQFADWARREDFYSEELIARVAQAGGSVQGFEELPLKIKEIFVTAHDISPKDHIQMQAAFQKHTDNAISKTVNFSSTAAPADVAKVYMLAYELGCKGVTIYRDKSRDVQILDTEGAKKLLLEAKVAENKLGQEEENGSCPECGVMLEKNEGCASCPACGYSVCFV